MNAKTFKADKPYSPQDLKAMVDSVRIHDKETIIERNQNGGGLHTYLNNLKMFLKSNNLLKKDFDAEKIFDNQAIMDALK